MALSIGQVVSVRYWIKTYYAVRNFECHHFLFVSYSFQEFALIRENSNGANKQAKLSEIMESWNHTWWKEM